MISTAKYRSANVTSEGKIINHSDLQQHFT